jgi:hypothetical protein
MMTTLMKRGIERSRHYYDIPAENTAVILSADLFNKMKSLPLSLAKIALDTIHMSYPNLIVTDVILLEAIGNVFNPHDRMIRSWIERCNVRICDTRIGAQLKEGTLPFEAATELSIDEAVNLCPVGTRAYRVDSDGNSWFRFRPIETADLEFQAHYVSGHQIGYAAQDQRHRYLNRPASERRNYKTANRMPSVRPLQIEPLSDLSDTPFEIHFDRSPVIDVQPAMECEKKSFSDMAWAVAKMMVKAVFSPKAASYQRPAYS